MLQRQSLLFCLIATLLGCGPTPQQLYDTALKNFDRAQARLDNLRPAYDAAREKAILAVCKEITGTTPEESALSALSQFEGAQSQAIASLTADPPAASGPAKDPDAVIDQLISAQTAMAEQHSALTGSLAKVNQTMTNINTPGTPEAARLAEILAKMPEAEAYHRQEKRLALAQEALDAAEAVLQSASGH